ncbi:MAG: hypothetical protein KAS32_00965 [Candidatus Peribacteraceae bacterium]|nr:hypothetical protein [Candidatus Peribacteraceae bacterium]
MAAPEGNLYWKLRERHGRNPKYSNADELWKDCIEYFEFMEENKYEFQDNKGTKNVNTIKLSRPYTVYSLCLYLDISRDTWGRWRKDNDLSYIVRKVDDIIYNQKFEGAVMGVYQQNIIIRDLGLKDETKTESSITVHWQESKDYTPPEDSDIA